LNAATNASPSILAVSTLGTGSNEEDRICDLLSAFPVDIFPFDRGKKLLMMKQLMLQIWRDRPDLVVMEGTGIAGGLPLILSRWLHGLSYVVSSGDAIGPWVGSHNRWMGWPFTVYEKLLCQWSAGFIGWTPYLVGRAMTFGAPRAMTASGWAPFHRTPEELSAARNRVRAELDIPADAIVIGIAGSMQWSHRFGFCYGYELVKAMQQLKREDVYALLVGDGSGRVNLEKIASIGPSVSRVKFTGRVPQKIVPDYLATMDIGSMPQSVDQTGSFRYTTKISEYLDCRLPMVTGHVPMGYDLDDGWIWRLPGDAPWRDNYIDALATLLENISRSEIEVKKNAIPNAYPLFDRNLQIERTTAFISDLLKLKKSLTSSSVVGPEVGHLESNDVRSMFASRPSSPSRPRKLLSIGHSYVLGVNRKNRSVVWR